MLIVLLFALLTSCTDLGTGPGPGLLADHSDIADPAMRWAAYGVRDYAILQARDCFCVDGGKRFIVSVRSGAIAGVVNPADGSPLPADRWGAFRTIPELFALARSIDPAHVASFHVEYDPRYGYPRSIYVDPSAQIADEEYGYETAIILEHELAEKP